MVGTRPSGRGLSASALRVSAMVSSTRISGTVGGCSAGGLPLVLRRRVAAEFDFGRCGWLLPSRHLAVVKLVEHALVHGEALLIGREGPGDYGRGILPDGVLNGRAQLRVTLGVLGREIGEQ